MSGQLTKLLFIRRTRDSLGRTQIKNKYLQKWIESSPMVYQQYGCLNKTLAMTIPMDMLTWKGEGSMDPSPKQRTIGTNEYLR